MNIHRTVLARSALTKQSIQPLDCFTGTGPGSQWRRFWASWRSSSFEVVMKFVRAIWKLLVGIKDALVLLFMLLFFGMIYAGLSARPAPVREGVLDLSLKGSVVEQPARREWADV